MFLPSAAAAAANGQVPGAGAPDEPAWTGFAMEQIMKTLSFVNSSLVQAPPEEKEKLAHKLDDTLYCAKVSCGAKLKIENSWERLPAFKFQP